MLKFGEKIVKLRIPILILSILLLIPAALGYFNTHVNYDILYYLPDEIDTMQGQDILMDEFGKGAYALFVCEGMDYKEVSALKSDIEDVDQLTRRFFRDVERIYRSHGPDYFGYEAHMDPFSLSYHNYFAPMTGALPNGRQKGVALTDASVSAMPGTDVNGSTALIKSAAQAIDTVRNNCNHMNMKFLPSALEGPSGTRMLLNLIKTYFDLGGGHIQFNCVSSETLCDAQEHPQNYKNLVVRVAGFSSYFTRLYKGVQDEIIKRTEYQNV